MTHAMSTTGHPNGFIERLPRRSPASQSPLLWIVWAGLVGGAAIGGCGEPGPDLHEVEGVARLEGSPLTDGSVSLRPDGTGGTFEQPTGSISPDGSFRVYTRGRPGAPPGRYRVVVFSNEPPSGATAAHPGMPRSVVPLRYNDPVKTPLLVEVIEAPEPGRYNLELVRDVPLPR
jgi:hypothetical protein